MKRWMFKRFVREQVRQGYDHDRRIASMFQAIISAARDEFREDNEPTARHYLTEWFSRAMDAEMELRRYRPMTPTLLSEIRKADD